MQITSIELNYASPSVRVERQFENGLLSSDFNEITPCAMIAVVIRTELFFAERCQLHS